jgi:hypothetical protein
VPGATVNVVNEDTRVTRETKTNELGYYAVPFLQPGRYRITVRKEGFRPLSRSGISLEVDQAAQVDFVMEVGTVSETVEVTGAVSAVDTQTATLKAVVDERRIRELPLNGRDATQLVALMPGIYATTDTSGLRQGGSGRGVEQPGFAANGARGNMVNYALDGAFHNDTYTNVALALPNPDALQEFSVQTSNFSAEFGRNGGAIVNAITKSGTNELHGSLFEFHRNEAANARNFFATTTDGLKRNQFGGTVGGPVYVPRLYNGRDRTFFFLSVQETRNVQRPSDASQVVLTEKQRSGDFSARSAPITDPLTRSPFPGNMIPISRMNVVTRNVLDRLIPLPTEPDTGLLRYSVPGDNQLRQVTLRMDQSFGPKDTLSGRYLYNYFHQPAFDTSLVFAAQLDRATPNHNVEVTHTHVFSPTTLNQLQFSVNRRTDLGEPVWKLGYNDLGMRNIHTDAPYHNFVLGVTGAFSASVTEKIVTSPHAYTVFDTFRRTIGRHEMSMGFEFRRQILDKFYRFLMDPSINFEGNFTGYGVSDFFLGLPSRLRQSAYGERAELQKDEYNAFFQDNIRITPGFKLNLGVRFEPYLPYVDAANRVSIFRPGSGRSQVYVNAPEGLRFPGDPGVPRGGTESSVWNLAPRVGFAWAPFGDTKTSIRSGYGIFFDAAMMSAIHNRFSNSPPHGLRLDLRPAPGPFDDPYAGNNPFPLPSPPPRDVVFPAGLITATYPDRFKTPYLQSWHFTIERELRSNWTVRAAYAGSKGTALLQGWQGNAAVYIPGRSTRNNLAERQPFAPAFSDVLMISSSGDSNYNSLQLTLDKRFSAGFTVLTNYTWGKSIDYGSGAGTLWPSYANPFDWSHNRGLSDFHHTHRFVSSWLWELPRSGVQSRLGQSILDGWNINGVLSLQTGQPFTVTSGQDNSLSGVGADRPDIAGDPSRDPNRDPVREWFNTRAFVQNREGTFGAAGRNILIGPGLAQLDLSLVKDIPVREQMDVQFRAESFNLFNRPNFGLPSASLTSGTYGRITSALSPRILQFGLKLRF